MLKNTPQRFLLLSIIVFILAFISYLPALQNGFVIWDTDLYVISNTHIHTLNWDSILWMLTSLEYANWHPLTWLSHAIDYALYGLEPFGHHLSSLIWHGLNSILLLYLALHILQASSCTNLSTFSNSTWIAASIAAIGFAIHPQHVESVVWVAERKDVLSLFFILLTFIFYFHYVQKLKNKNSNYFFFYIAAVISFTLAIMSKPMSVTVPALLVLLDIYPLKRLSFPANTRNLFIHILWKRVILEKLPFWILTLLSIILTLIAQTKMDAVANLDNLGIELRLLNALHGTVFYLEKFFWPYPLLPFYPHISKQETFNFLHYAPFIFIVLTALSLYLARQGKTAFLVAWLFYLVSLSPVIGIIQVGAQGVADRYAYLPTIPLYLILGASIAALWHWLSINNQAINLSKLLVASLLLGLFAVLSWRTQAQSQLWHNGLTLWQYAAEHYPKSDIPHRNLSSEYAVRKNYEAALRHAEFSFLLSTNLENRLRLAKLYSHGKAWTQNIQLLEQALQTIDMENTPAEQLLYAHFLLANAYVETQQKEKAKNLLEKARQTLPTSIDKKPIHEALSQL